MDTRDPGGPRPGRTEPEGLAPVRAFFLVCALATVLGAAFFATREATPSEPPAPARSPDYSLTDEEAIAEFERLRSAAIDAVRERDVSLIDKIATASGPLHRRATREIAALIREGVVDRTQFESQDVEVVRNEPTEILILERTRLEPCFRTIAGKDVSTGPDVVLQSAEWTLRLSEETWLLHKAVVVADDAVDQSEATCA